MLREVEHGGGLVGWHTELENGSTLQAKSAGAYCLKLKRVLFKGREVES